MIANPTKLVRADFFISFQPGKDGPVRAHSKGLTAAIGRLRHAVRPVRPSLYLPRGLLPAAACRRAVFAAVRRPQLRFRLVEQICADQGPDRRAAKDQTRCEACAPKLTPPPRPAARCRLPPRYFYVRQAPLMSSGASRGEQDDSRPSRRTDAEVSLTQLMCANMPSLLVCYLVPMHLQCPPAALF